MGYDPALGRFIQPDSIIPDLASSKGFDRYAYSNNNPINYNDPSGHKACSDFDENGNCIKDSSTVISTNGYTATHPPIIYKAPIRRTDPLPATRVPSIAGLIPPESGSTSGQYYYQPHEPDAPSINSNSSTDIPSFTNFIGLGYSSGNTNQENSGSIEWLFGNVNALCFSGNYGANVFGQNADLVIYSGDLIHLDSVQQYQDMEIDHSIP